MKLTENNARYAIVKTAFHGGGTISFHSSLSAAIAAKKKNTDANCTCGCCGIVAVTEDARSEGGEYLGTSKLYADIAEYTANGEHYSKLCR